MEYTVGIGDFAISKNKKDILKIFALGTCVGVVIHDEKKDVLALLHIFLPERGVGMDDSKTPYAETAIPYVINLMKERYFVETSDLKAFVYGGMDSSSKLNPFYIGERNLKKTIESLQKLGVKYTLQNVGGHNTRTLIIENRNIKVIEREMSRDFS